MNTATGTVKKIMQRGKAYNFVLEENGQDVWYGHGFAPPKFNEGDSVTFTWTPNGNFKNVDARSVQVQQGQAPAQQSAQNKPAGKSGGYQSNQLAIQYQASRNSAIALLDVMMQNNAVSLPTKKGDQYDAILSLVDDLTNHFHVKTDKVVEAGGIVLEELEQVAVTPDNF